MDKFQSGKYKFSSVKPLFLIGNYVIGEMITRGNKWINFKAVSINFHQ